MYHSCRTLLLFGIIFTIAVIGAKMQNNHSYCWKQSGKFIHTKKLFQDVKEYSLLLSQEKMQSLFDNGLRCRIEETTLNVVMINQTFFQQLHSILYYAAWRLPVGFRLEKKLCQISFYDIFVFFAAVEDSVLIGISVFNVYY